MVPINRFRETIFRKVVANDESPTMTAVVLEFYDFPALGELKRAAFLKRYNESCYWGNIDFAVQLKYRFFISDCVLLTDDKPHDV